MEYVIEEIHGLKLTLLDMMTTKKSWLEWYLIMVALLCGRVQSHTFLDLQASLSNSANFSYTFASQRIKQKS